MSKKYLPLHPLSKTRAPLYARLDGKKKKIKEFRKFLIFFLGGITFLFYLCIRFPSFWRVVEFYERLMDRGQAASGDYSD